MKKFVFLSFIFIGSCPLLAATIIIDGKKHTANKLLKHMAVEKVKLKESLFKKPFTFEAIPLGELVTDLKGSYLTFKSLDGFASTISVEKLFQGKSTSYLAIENPKKPWPKYNKKISPGPFYLIWKVYDQEKIGQELWPFQISEISFSSDPKVLYPKLYPKSLSPSAKKGFKVFITSCFACHKIQKMGTAVMGPDLNYPMNPTEYFKNGILKKFIRNPRSIRDWPDRQMPGFSKKEMSDNELNNLIKYLEEISRVL